MTRPAWKTYEKIGVGYRGRRVPDPRIEAVIHREIGDARTIVNLGAGAGSYEPTDRKLIAVEPSRRMIAQRPSGAAPVVEARAERLPFADDSFDCATAFLTVHHWADRARGIAEARRVARRLVFLSWIEFPRGFWLIDYFPEILEIDRRIFPSEAEFSELLGGARSVVVPIPRDCIDGFLCAYWARPEAYLDPEVRRAISSFSKIERTEEGVARLAGDLASGAWEEKYGASTTEASFDFGYRVFVAGAARG